MVNLDRVGPLRRRRPGLLAYGTDDAQLVVCNNAVVSSFKAFIDVVVVVVNALQALATGRIQRRDSDRRAATPWAAVTK